jgi:hypothetical protein
MVEHIDLMVDEFKRIKACPGADAEIRDLCDRAIQRTHQNVPVIVQRDEAQEEARRLRIYAETLEEALTPRRWTLAMSKAWHVNIPDTMKAFAALLEVAKAAASIPTGVPEPKVDHVFPLYPDTRQEAHEISTQFVDIDTIVAQEESTPEGMARMVEARQELWRELAEKFAARVGCDVVPRGSRLQRGREIPEGWKLVPVVPTKRMTCEAFICATNVAPDGWSLGSNDSQEFFGHIYRAMLGIAPDCEYRT